MFGSQKSYGLSDPFRENKNFLETLSQISTSFSSEIPEEPVTAEDVNIELDVNLPIHKYRQEITAKVSGNQCIVLTGSTGCGKTTQVPKIIIDDARKQNKTFNILVSQPRKIAAITNAQRVAQEMKVQLGTLVGFQVSLHRTSNEETKLLFCSTGVILQKLMRARSMQMYTHIILDEIHERDIELDFLLILVRQYLRTNSPNTKVILMSATVDAKHFQNYFSLADSDIPIDIPIINMNLQRDFSITKKFLDELDIASSAHVIDFESPRISEELMQIAAELVYNHVQTDKSSSILVFLPGLYEIESFEKVLLYKFDVLQNFQIIILHSAMPPVDQQRAFARDDKPKIILSTNIAENSVTIPKVNVVIDFCLTKHLVASKDGNLASLELNWTSRMSSEQRAGRTGRVCDGLVYHLVPKGFYKSEMLEFTKPEMQRVPLERVILKSKLLSAASPMSFLMNALDPPEQENVINSILILKELGAMQRLDDQGNFYSDDGELTYCGRVMAQLPCDIYVAKFIVLGYLYSVLEETVIIGAGLSINGSIFKFDYRKCLLTYSRKLSWSDASGSDLIAIMNVYKLWRSNKRQGLFTEAFKEQRWFDMYNLDKKNLYEMKEMIGELRQRLEEHNIGRKKNDEYPPILEDREKAIMVKICVAGAWYPYYFVQELPTETTERDVYRQINHKNVHRTFYFKDMENKYTTYYDDMLKKALVDRGICERVEDIVIEFNSQSSQKIFVTVTRDQQLTNTVCNRGIKLVDGNILGEVYVAMKYKELSHGIFKLDVMDKSSIKRYASQVGYFHVDTSDQVINESLNQSSASSATLGIHEMKGFVTHVEHCGKFFFKPTGHKYVHENNIMEYKMRLAATKLEPVQQEIDLTDGDLVIINYGGKQNRGSVMKTPGEPIKFNLMDLGFITEDIPLSDVRHCPKSQLTLYDSPPRCFECRLSEISPAVFKSPRSVWTDEANNYFRKHTIDKQSRIEIFSVVDEIVSVVLFVTDDTFHEVTNMNEKMKEAGFAEHCDENLPSRLNSIERSSQNLSFCNTTITSSNVNDPTTKTTPYKPLLPPRGLMNATLNLAGPQTPLQSSLFSVLNTECVGVKIDDNSINSVVLNGDVNSMSSRLYVASNISKNRRNGFTLREVTMFPKIPGAPELLALIFCPQMTLRRNKEKTSYTMLHTGLGFVPGPDEYPYFPLHDATLPVTVKITSSDFKNINELRSCMSKLLYTEPNVEYPELNERDKYDLQVNIKDCIAKILRPQRDICRILTEPLKRAWITDETDMVAQPDPFGTRSMYSVHQYPKLNEPKKPAPLKYKPEHLANLNSSKTSISCTICDIPLCSTKDMQDHLKSTYHKQMVNSLKLNQTDV